MAPPRLPRPALADQLPPEIVAADAADPMASFRARFRLPDGLIYLDGNSLGALPADTPARLAEVVAREWGEGLIGSWNSAGWIDAPERLGDRIAPLVGAGAGEVLVADSTSVNLFKLLAAALTAKPERGVILSEPGNFPTDLYIADGLARLLPGRELRLVEADDIAEAIDEDVAAVVLTHVHYKTARRLDMAALTAAAKARGARVVWDLSHSVGAVEIALNASGAELAIGCGYKYLNGGPGAPAFLYVARALQEELRSPLAGWMGHGRRFDFLDAYEPAPGVARFLCGTPPILGLAALEVGVALTAEAGIERLATKSAALAEALIGAVEARCAGQGLMLVTPREAGARGSHVSFAHPQAYAVCQALIARGVVGDFRAPDILRLGLTPLYTRFADVWAAACTLEEVLKTRAYDDPRYRERAAVT